MSRTTLIEFSLPEIAMDASLQERELWDDMEDIKCAASATAGLCVAIGKKLEETGIREEFTPFVQASLKGAQPRVVMVHFQGTYIDCITNLPYLHFHAKCIIICI